MSKSDSAGIDRFIVEVGEFPSITVEKSSSPMYGTTAPGCEGARRRIDVSRTLTLTRVRSLGTTDSNAYGDNISSSHIDHDMDIYSWRRFDEAAEIGRPYKVRIEVVRDPTKRKADP